MLNGRHTIQTVTESPSSTTTAKNPPQDSNVRKTLAMDGKDEPVSSSKRKSAQEKRKTQLQDLQEDEPLPTDDLSEDPDSHNKDMKRERNKAMSMSELDVEIEL